MSGLKHIKNRIQSVKNTQQITKAMKMVSASKLRRAQNNIETAREYSEKLRELISSLSFLQGEVKNPLLEERQNGKAVVVLITSDKGLCGALNTNLCKLVVQNFPALNEIHPEIEFYCLGKKGRDFLKRRNFKVVKDFVDKKDHEKETAVDEIFHDITDRYALGEINAVYIAHNKFKSIMTQEQVMFKMLPLTHETDEKGAEVYRDFMFEPDPETIVNRLLPEYVSNIGYIGMLDHLASEHSARMTAMDAATRNAGEMISKLRLFYNRARQAAITTELTEIISGAESINK